MFKSIILGFMLLGLALNATAAEKSATYQIIFTNHWNAQDHLSFPSNAHFSPIVALSHNSNYELLALGALATKGFEGLAETGATGRLEREIAAAESANFVLDRVKTAALFPRTDGDVVTFTLEVSSKKPLISFATMIAPSPDWVVGVNSFNTIKKGYFVQNSFMELFALNAGTENGDRPGNFSINNSATRPQQPISQLKHLKGLNLPFASVEIRKIK